MKTPRQNLQKKDKSHKNRVPGILDDQDFHEEINGRTPFDSRHCSDCNLSHRLPIDVDHQSDPSSGYRHFGYH